MHELLATVRALRAPDGCPWDRRQTHASLRRHLLEEAAEAVDALTHADDAAMRDELGDVLLQIAFHAVIAAERNAFDYADVESAIVAKMRRRHPHVFGPEAGAGDPTDAELDRQWRAIKRREADERDAARSRDGVPRSLPAAALAGALARAHGWAEDAAGDARVADPSGDAPSSGDALGDALLALAVQAAGAGHDPETLLRDAIARREARSPDAQDAQDAQDAAGEVRAP